MIKSMTGFGRGEYTDGKRSVIAEIRAVNHRYCEIGVRLPRAYAFAEERIRAAVRETVRRGKADVTIITDVSSGSDVRIGLNPSVAEQYRAVLTEIQERFGLTGDIDPVLFANLPDVLSRTSEDEDEEALTLAFVAATQNALRAFDAMRAAEGERLAEDILKRVDLIADCVREAEARAPQITRVYAEKLKARVRELLDGGTEAPEERIALEAAVFAEKSDFTEEAVRLGSHIAQLRRAMTDGDAANGKKSDFLVQEMNREANTIGSKANDLTVTALVLDVKSELEKIREQVQNIE